ncbi:hydroxyphenylacetyl-CoA thioesterase PaaI [Metallumcola ferriviriculae]|uniref:Hydroxyphenylacetyl-CoA thioesterase PaaI n=1 Tax=Metallumcola ferriviriculae TaxID=3039180 RepID=A0AAU0ULX1_9FIRM|nr:hydroxyphenylacetyl-CoA thioesterase PaaI [Desulfitibacteraceae bacterium MK1]
MTGNLEEGIVRVERDAYAKHLGIKVQEIKPGYARVTMGIMPELLNGVGITHGGAIFSLADFAFAAASNSRGKVAVALDVHISYLKATFEGEVLTAVAMEDNLTKRTGLYRMEVTDGEGQKVAVAEGRVYRKTDSLKKHRSE